VGRDGGERTPMPAVDRHQLKKCVGVAGSDESAPEGIPLDPAIMVRSEKGNLMAQARTELPKPSADWDRLRADLDEHGYCLLANALSSEQVASIKARLLDQAAGEVADGMALRDGGVAEAGTTPPNQRVMNMLDKGEEFWQLLLHPIVDEVVCHLLGENVISSSVTANIANPGGQPMALHSDQGYVDIPIIDAVVCNTLWMLTDFTAENGGTNLIPGSHHWNRYPDPVDDYSQCIALEGPVGTACVFDGRVWHGTGSNLTADTSRVGLLNYWCRPWLRQQENMAASLRSETVVAMPEKLLRRIGFQVHGTLGNIDPKPNRVGTLVDPSRERVGRRSAE